MNERSTEYWNDDADKYRQLADLLKVVAEDHCQVPIDNDTHQRWAEMMALLTEVDAYIDERIVPGLNAEEDIVDELERFDRFRERYPHLAPEVVGELMWRDMERTARDVVGCFQELAYATTYDEYVEWRTKEAIATAELFDVCATEETRSNPDFEKVFMVRLKNMAVGACLLDSANDLKRDFKEGQAMLRPTLWHRANLLYDSVTLSLPQLDMLRHRSVCREIGRAALLHTGRHMQRLYPHRKRPI